MVCKLKKKKRFGSSILRHAPGLLSVLVVQKAQRYGLSLMEVDAMAFKASQYNHADDTYKSPALSERTKTIDGHLDQRDGYSSFILKHATDETHTLREACIKDFKNFLRRQGKAVTIVLHTGDVTGTFGLKDFLKNA